MKLSKNIYNLRKSNGFTMEELGKKIGVSKQTIKRYESGEIKNIPYDTIIALANSLGVSPAELMGFEEMKNPTHDEKIGIEYAKMLKKYAKLPQKVQNDISAIIDDFYELYSSEK